MRKKDFDAAIASARAQGSAEGAGKREYNGLSNYETWNVALWIDNEQSTSEYWKEQAQDAYDRAADTPSANAKLNGVEPFTHEERATLSLSDGLKAAFEDEAPELDGCYADLLNAALSEVNWHEIAQHMIEECDKTEAVES